MAQKSKSTRPSFKLEAFAVFGIFVSLFLFLSLISYALQVKSNWCGQIGLLIAQSLFGFTGWGAYLLPSLTLLLSFLFFGSGMSFQRLPQVTAGLTGAIISFCGLLSSLVLKDPTYFKTGGFLGKTGFSLLNSVVGDGGTVMVFVLIFLISLMLATQFSPYQLVLIIWTIIKKCLGMLVSDPGENRDKKAIKTANKSRLRAEKPAKPVLAPQVLQTVAVPEVQELAAAAKSTGDDDDFAAKPIARGDWKMPPLSFLSKNMQVQEKIDKEVYYKISKQLEQKLINFGVSGKVVGISPGPVVTTYEYAPAPGVKINKIVGLADDLALGLKARSVRVVGSVPGKAALGIEIPNDKRQIVYIRDLISAEAYQANSNKLSIALGLDVVGNLSMANLAKMPHLLIAGATGAGKSVGINTIIASILYNATPEEVRFLMVDPKRIELSGYEGIPHLLHPVVVDPKLASRALNWAVREMERRYKLLEEARVKSFDSYNETSDEKLPYSA